MALTDEKYEKKQNLLVERTARALGVDEDAAVELLSIERKQSLRINTLARPYDAIISDVMKLDLELRPVEWMKGGYFVDANLSVARDSKLTEVGELYIQNAASWLPVVALKPKRGDRILDVCAAPGGKTSHIAQLADNEAFIYANDNSRPRLMKLQHNLARLHVTNVTTTLHDATRLSSRLADMRFNKILLDAPCSGEGMMTLADKKSFESWSVAHIKRLQQLQKKILVQAWNLLEPGGALVYSTCTMAPEENEAVVDYLLRHNDDVHIEDLSELKSQLSNAVPAVTEWNGKHFDERIAHALRLKPSTDIEAFFVVKLTKKPL